MESLYSVTSTVPKSFWQKNWPDQKQYIYIIYLRPTCLIVGVK